MKLFSRQLNSMGEILELGYKFETWQNLGKNEADLNNYLPCEIWTENKSGSVANTPHGGSLATV